MANRGVAFCRVAVGPISAHVALVVARGDGGLHNLRLSERAPPQRDTSTQRHEQRETREQRDEQIEGEGGEGEGTEALALYERAGPPRGGREEERRRTGRDFRGRQEVVAVAVINCRTVLCQGLCGRCCRLVCRGAGHMPLTDCLRLLERYAYGGYTLQPPRHRARRTER